MQIISKEEVQDCLSAKRAGEYDALIEGLESGMALRVNAAEWVRRTGIDYYFLGKYNRRGKKVLSVRRIGQREYLVIKL